MKLLRPINPNYTIIIITFIACMLSGLSYYWFTKSEYNHNKLKDYIKHTILSIKVDSIIYNAEGKTLKNVELRNNKGEITFDKLYEGKRIIMVIYQNGLVCDPCMQLLTKYWSKKQNNTNTPPNNLILISNVYNDEQYHKLEEKQLGNAYYIDINKEICKTFDLGGYPINYMLLFDENMMLLHADYFTAESENHMINFIAKCNRIVENIHQ